jgi:hypothetical protein
MLRAVEALGVFAVRWELPLNPEDLGEMAYAVLTHAGEPDGVFDQAAVDTISEAVTRQVEHARRQHAEMTAGARRGA